MSTSTVRTYAPERACAKSDVDPEWWVHEHTGKCPKGCAHGLAAHICIYHCPFLESCQDEMSLHPENYRGMVLGGLMEVRQKRDGIVAAVPKTLRLTCEACRQRAFVS